MTGPGNTTVGTLTRLFKFHDGAVVKFAEELCGAGPADGRIIEGDEGVFSCCGESLTGSVEHAVDAGNPGVADSDGDVAFAEGWAGPARGVSAR